jgi:hypothetical protein
MLAYSTVSKGPFVERLGRDAGVTFKYYFALKVAMLHSIPRL